VARGNFKPKPETESEQLAYYKALHHLRETANDEDAIQDSLIALYRKQCEYINMIKPFMTWEGVGRILGTSAAIVKGRYRNYSNEVMEFEED
jgi:hypothetical protein